MIGVAFGVLIALIACAGLVVMIVRKLKRPELNGLSPEKVKKLWAEIEQSAKQGNMGKKMALIEADKLLDNVLKAMMIPGDTMGERLKMAAYKYPKIREVWTAHKLRNQLVHETSFELSERDTKRALSDFERALKLVNVL